MVEREEELGNVKRYNASVALSKPSCMNNMYQVYSCISGGSLSDAS